MGMRMNSRKFKPLQESLIDSRKLQIERFMKGDLAQTRPSETAAKTSNLALVVSTHTGSQDDLVWINNNTQPLNSQVIGCF